MRITTRISASGNNSYSRFPEMKLSLDECKNEQGLLDEGKVRKALSCDLIQWSNRDTLRIGAFAIEFLYQLYSVFMHLVDDGRYDVRHGAVTKQDLAAYKNMKKGKYMFLRLDINEVGGKIRARISIGNPYEVKGNVFDKTLEDASIFSQILFYIQEHFGKQYIDLVEGEGCEGIFKRAAEDAKKYDLEKEAKKEAESLQHCPNRCGQNKDYCSPIKPSCKFFLNGKCSLSSK